MAKLTDEQQKQLDELKALAEAPDTQDGPAHSRVENVNYTIDLENEAQVKRAVRAGLLPASWLDDDDDDPDGDDSDDPEPDPEPRRRLSGRY